MEEKINYIENKNKINNYFLILNLNNSYLLNDLNEIIFSFIEELDNIIILKCIEINNKKKIKYYCKISKNGNITSYKENFYCQFPKEIRNIGEYYMILENDIKLNKVDYYYYKNSYYIVKSNNIQVIQPNINYIEKCSCMY